MQVVNNFDILGIYWKHKKLTVRGSHWIFQKNLMFAKTWKPCYCIDIHLDHYYKRDYKRVNKVLKECVHLGCHILGQKTSLSDQKLDWVIINYPEFIS